MLAENRQLEWRVGKPPPAVFMLSRRCSPFFAPRASITLACFADHLRFCYDVMVRCRCGHSARHKRMVLDRRRGSSSFCCLRSHAAKSTQHRALRPALPSKTKALWNLQWCRLPPRPILWKTRDGNVATDPQRPIRKRNSPSIASFTRGWPAIVGS